MRWVKKYTVDLIFKGILKFTLTVYIKVKRTMFVEVQDTETMIFNKL